MNPLDDPSDPPAGWAHTHVRQYIATDGADDKNGHIWRRGAPVLLLTTIGRRSGRGRRTPLIYGRDGDRYLVVASLGGSDHAPKWFDNLVADPRVRVQVLGDVFDAQARPATAEEQSRLWPTMTAIWPDYDTYQKRTDRPIPVVVLERRSGDEA